MSSEESVFVIICSSSFIRALSVDTAVVDARRVGVDLSCACKLSVESLSVRCWLAVGAVSASVRGFVLAVIAMLLTSGSRRLSTANEQVFHERVLTTEQNATEVFDRLLSLRIALQQ